MKSANLSAAWSSTPCLLKFRMSRSIQTKRALLRSFFALPLVALKIVAAIHWQALRLWLKGARLAPRQNAAVAKSVSPGLAPVNSNDYSGPALTTRGGALWSSEGRH